jgi:hypothetical protein
LSKEADNIPIEFDEDFNMANELALLIRDLLNDTAYQVKKCATASLLYIVEKQLLETNKIEEIIIPSLLNLMHQSNDDFHIDCISIMAKLCGMKYRDDDGMFGRHLTTKYFLEPFCCLCSSPVFHTRKACASSIVDLANVTSQEEVEKVLLPYFCEFIKDQVWAIRKVSAENFTLFAGRCSRKTRETVLTEPFVKLLDDPSRWVKSSAFRVLGSFIATFLKDPNDPEVLEETKSEEKEESSNELKMVYDTTTTTNNNNNNTQIEIDVEKTKQVEQKKEEEEEEEEKVDNLPQIKIPDNNNKNDEYSNFMYWRNELPTLESNYNEEDDIASSTILSMNSIDETSGVAALLTTTPQSPMKADNESKKSEGEISRLTISSFTSSNFHSNHNDNYSTPTWPSETKSESSTLAEVKAISEQLKQVN